MMVISWRELFESSGELRDVGALNRDNVRRAVPVHDDGRKEHVAS